MKELKVAPHTTQAEALERLASKYQDEEEIGHCGRCKEQVRHNNVLQLEELITPDPDSDAIPKLEDLDVAQILNDSPPVDDADPSKLQINFEGYKKTVTGVVKILRVNGSEDPASLLEEFAALAEASQHFFRAKRRATATTHRAIRKPK